MRNILRLALTLVLVGILSASLLTFMHNITDPIVKAREEEEYRAALNNYYPGFADFESETFDQGQFDLIFDQDGELMGVMATVTTTGYDGDVVYNLPVDQEGNIIGLRIVSHTETPGIGDVITTDSFQEQFVGKNYEDPISPGEDVDTVTGATVSTSAMINSIRNTVNTIAENYLGIETVEVDIAEVPDGTYQGTAQGFMGPIVVEVEVSGGEIVNIEVLEQEETATYFVESYPLIPERIIEEQSLDVDTQTGATNSAEGIVSAVENALLEATGVDIEPEEPEEEEPEEDPVEVDISSVPDGTYQGSAEGFMGQISVEVEVSGGEIVDIEILEHEDTPEYFRESNPLIPERIIEEQSLDIDTQTGATNSAEGIRNAVFDALSGALNNGGGGEEN
ncbi:MAG: FMN-binding protein [Bacillota bacterium]